MYIYCGNNKYCIAGNFHGMQFSCFLRMIDKLQKIITQRFTT